VNPSHNARNKTPAQPQKNQEKEIRLRGLIEQSDKTYDSFRFKSQNHMFYTKVIDHPNYTVLTKN
jgi:hypothetical protein